VGLHPAPVTKPLRDVTGPGLRVLFVGINPSLTSARLGHHFARPGNRFWPALHLAGFTPRRLAPDEDMELLEHGVGVTNLVDRPTRVASALSREELREGARRLEALVRELEPRLVAIVGITAWRTAFDRPRAQLGLQDETLGGRPVWVLPNPSGLNAHHQLPDLARLYGEARAYAAEISKTRRRAGGTLPA
jgi:TDG/mug DNA glycosylase family protein